MRPDNFTSYQYINVSAPTDWEKCIIYLWNFFPKIYLWIPYSTESQLVEHLQSNGKWNAKLIIK